MPDDVAELLPRKIPKNLRYNLSDPIPVSFLKPDNKGYENIQQLKIKNIGNKIAERVVVKIEKKITSYEVMKVVKTDEFKKFMDEKSLEIEYPILPLQADFTVIFQSPEGIKSEELNIRCNTVVAKEALSNSSDIKFILLLFVIISYSFIIFGIFDVFVNLWKSDSARKA